jgi:hypothetical protein
MAVNEWRTTTPNKGGEGCKDGVVVVVVPGSKRNDVIAGRIAIKTVKVTCE